MCLPRVLDIPGSIPCHDTLICGMYLHSARSAQGVLAYCPINGGDTAQSIGSTVANSVVHSWLGSAATKSCTLGYFSSISASTVVGN